MPRARSSRPFPTRPSPPLSSQRNLTAEEFQMSDIDTRTVRQPSSPDFSDKMQKAGGNASDALGSASETARGKLDELGAVAKNTASQAADKMRDQVESQRNAGADYA